MAKALKFWHQWGWIASIIGYLVLFGVTVGTRNSAIAQSQKDIVEIQQQKIPERMATQEQSTKDIKEQLTRMEGVQGQIFQRINQIVDKHGR